MDGVHFSSSDMSFFKSKNAKNNLKKILKDLFLKNENNFLDEVKKISVDLEQKYLKQDKLYKSKFEVNLEETNNKKKKINIKLFRKEDGREINRQKLKSRLKEIKNNYQKKKVDKENLKIQKKMKSDKRVTIEMKNLYYKALMKSNENAKILNPVEILDDLEENKDKFKEYLDIVVKGDYHPYAKFLMYNNDYTKYMSLMTGVSIKMPEELENETRNLYKDLK